MQAAQIGHIAAEAALFAVITAYVVKQNRSLQAQLDELREELRHVVVHVDGAQQDLETRVGSTERRLQQLGRPLSHTGHGSSGTGTRQRAPEPDNGRRAPRVAIDAVDDDGYHAAPHHTPARATRLPFGESARGRNGPLSHASARPTPRDIPSVQEEEEEPFPAPAPRAAARVSPTAATDTLDGAEEESGGAARGDTAGGAHEDAVDDLEDDVASELSRRARR